MEHKDHSEHGETTGSRTRESHYGRLGLMTALSFVAMYVLMYAMVNTLDNVYMNFNQVYMAGLMAAPMVLIELALMRSMYHNKRLNAAIAAGAVVVAVVLFLFIRRQTAVGDREFLRSMIPHHASAILMCQQASIRAPDIKRLCDRPQGILESQQAEIDQMKAMLRER
jgi:peptidoglycan/LPS O-acetylase OafA/YrhL